MRVSADNLKPDMVLASDIVDGLGRLLLPAGTKLTDKHLRYCQMWGILEADIQGDEPPVEEGSVLDPAALSAAATMLDPRFQLCNRADPVIEQLYAFCLQRQARRPRP